VQDSALTVSKVAYPDQFNVHFPEITLIEGQVDRSISCFVKKTSQRQPLQWALMRNRVVLAHEEEELLYTAKEFATHTEMRHWRAYGDKVQYYPEGTPRPWMGFGQGKPLCEYPISEVEAALLAQFSSIFPRLQHIHEMVGSLRYPEDRELLPLCAAEFKCLFEEIGKGISVMTRFNALLGRSHNVRVRWLNAYQESHRMFQRAARQWSCQEEEAMRLPLESVRRSVVASSGAGVLKSRTQVLLEKWDHSPQIERRCVFEREAASPLLLEEIRHLRKVEEVEFVVVGEAENILSIERVAVAEILLDLRSRGKEPSVKEDQRKLREFLSAELTRLKGSGTGMERALECALEECHHRFEPS
jgi:hypothetical protein